MIFKFNINGTDKEFTPKTWRLFKRYVKVSYEYLNGGLDDTYRGARLAILMAWEEITAVEKTDLALLVDAIRRALPVKLMQMKENDGTDTGRIPSYGYLMKMNSDEISESEGDVLEILPIEIELESKNIIDRLVTGLSLSWPGAIALNTSITFTVTATPSDAFEPVDYSWSAYGNAVINHLAQDLNDQAAFTFTSVNGQNKIPITITVTNASGVFSQTFELVIGQVAV